MFQQTKKDFDINETLKIQENSFEAIVKELEIYNLSKTSDDVKGIAFEKFIGKTFREEDSFLLLEQLLILWLKCLIPKKEKKFEIKAKIKSQFDYPISIANVEKAGISAKGAEIENELIPLCKEFTENQKQNPLWQIFFNKMEFGEDGKMFRISSVVKPSFTRIEQKF